jgi:hypothetical protein
MLEGASPPHATRPGLLCACILGVSFVRLEEGASFKRRGERMFGRPAKRLTVLFYCAKPPRRRQCAQPYVRLLAIASIRAGHRVGGFDDVFGLRR